MKKSLLLFVMLLVASSLAGCATMFGEKTQQLSFKSKPTGAEVVVGAQTCTTPCTLTIVKSKMNIQASFSKDGYLPQQVFLNGNLDPLVYMNAMNMFVGSVVDLSTGAMFKYEPEYLAVLSKK